MIRQAGVGDKGVGQGLLDRLSGSSYCTPVQGVGNKFLMKSSQMPMYTLSEVVWKMGSSDSIITGSSPSLRSASASDTRG